MFPLSIQANENNYIITDSNDTVVNKIDEFFLKVPQEKHLIWRPKIEGKSRFSFSIPKDAYMISKKHADASDLYYLSEEIDNGITFQQNRSKSIDIFISKNNSKVIFNQKFLTNINAGLFYEKKQKSFGVIVNKEFTISKNAMGDFGFKQDKAKYTILNSRFVKLTNNENS